MIPVRLLRDGKMSGVNKAKLDRGEFATAPLKFEPQMMAFDEDYEIRTTTRWQSRLC